MTFSSSKPRRRGTLAIGLLAVLAFVPSVASHNIFQHKRAATDDLNKGGFLPLNENQVLNEEDGFFQLSEILQEDVEMEGNITVNATEMEVLGGNGTNASSILSETDMTMNDTSVNGTDEVDNDMDDETVAPSLETDDMEDMTADNQTTTAPSAASYPTTASLPAFTTITFAFLIQADPSVWDNTDTTDVLEQASQDFVETISVRRRRRSMLRQQQTRARRLASVDEESVAIYNVKPADCSATVAPTSTEEQTLAENTTVANATRTRLLQGNNNDDANQTSPTTNSCVKVSVKYSVILEEGEDPETLQQQYQAATILALEQGKLQESIGKADPNSGLQVVGPAEPAPLSSRPPDEDSPPTSAAPTTPSPTTVASPPTTTETLPPTDQSEEEADDDDGGSSTNVVGIVLGVVFGVLGCCLLVALIVFRQKVKDTCAPICRCCCPGNNSADGYEGFEDEGGESKRFYYGDEETPEEQAPAVNATFDQDQEEDEEEENVKPGGEQLELVRIIEIPLDEDGNEIAQGANEDGMVEITEVIEVPVQPKVEKYYEEVVDSGNEKEGWFYEVTDVPLTQEEAQELELQEKEEVGDSEGQANIDCGPGEEGWAYETIDIPIPPEELDQYEQKDIADNAEGEERGQASEGEVSEISDVAVDGPKEDGGPLNAQEETIEKATEDVDGDKENPEKRSTENASGGETAEAEKPERTEEDKKDEEATDGEETKEPTKPTIESFLKDAAEDVKSAEEEWIEEEA